MRIVNYKHRINQIYNPPINKINNNNKNLNKYFPYEKACYFSFGRYAIFNALQCIGVIKGDIILVPSLICKDLLSAINSLEAYPVYYDVDKQMMPIINIEDLPISKAIIAVNYFGFPQNLSSLIKYCKKTGSVLIEDNAHGFLSRDENGIILGSRASLGIFSIRKTIPLINGAALIINDKKYIKESYVKSHFKRYRSINYYCKEILRKCFPFIQIRGIRMFIYIGRIFKKIRIGNFISKPDLKSEINLPNQKLPTSNLLDQINAINIHEEISRRRELYLWINNLIIELDVKPVFNYLPKNCVPYTFPFFSSDKKAKKIEKIFNSYGMEIFKWPNLPDQIKDSAPEFYRSIWCVSFLW